MEIIPHFPYNEGLLIRDARQMENLYRSGKVDFCITIFYKVRDILKSRGVPVFILQPSFDDIRAGLQRLVLTNEQESSHNNPLAVMTIKTDMETVWMPEGGSFQLSIEKLHISREVCQFSKLLHAACIEQPPWGYILFTTRKDMESATDNYSRLPLMRNISESTAFTISIGIGYGNGGDEAEYHSMKALQQAQAHGGSKAYLIGRNISTPIPMSKTADGDHLTSKGSIDTQFFYLSRKAGVSLRMIAKLYYACQSSGKRRFTSFELADMAGVTPRTMNRILNKLIDHHLAQDVGRHFTVKTGRPGRIIEILFETKRKEREK